MHSPVWFLLIATFLPLLGAGIVTFLGRRMGSPLSGWIGSGFSIASFGLTLAAMVRWYEGRQGIENWGMDVRAIVRMLALPNAGGSFWRRGLAYFYPGIYVDSLTIATFAMLTLVTAIIHVYSIGS